MYRRFIRRLNPSAFLRASFEGVIDQTLFSSAFVRGPRLLREREKLSEQGKAELIKALRANFPNPKRRGHSTSAQIQHSARWLTAIKDRPGSAFCIKTDVRSRPSSPTTIRTALATTRCARDLDPHPYGRESVVAFAEDGSLVGERLNEFKETDSWRGPTLGGLIEGLQAAVAEFQPDTFLRFFPTPRRAKIAFQHALISGFKAPV